MDRKNAKEMYLIQNERKSVVDERFFRTLKNKIYTYMISTSKNIYINKFDIIINKYNNTHHGTIKIKSDDVKPSTHIGFNKENNREGPKIKSW